MAITFPSIDPVLIELGPLKIHWYALAYIAAAFLGFLYASSALKKYPNGLTKELLEKYIFGSAVFGVIIGGRLGHILFYDLSYYLVHPLEILMTWKGGMSFHGGLLGVIIAGILFCRYHKIHLLQLMDVMAILTPIGLGLGRVSNFINAELYGTPTFLPWGVIFPYSDGLPRHPTQLYEAFFEGFVLWVILGILWKKPSFRLTQGRISGVFLGGYGIFRFGIEFFKSPEAQQSYLFADTLTMGHMLCFPMILLGILIFFLNRPKS